LTAIAKATVVNKNIIYSTAQRLTARKIHDHPLSCVIERVIGVATHQFRPAALALAV
jgi:hypothetical protein